VNEGTRNITLAVPDRLLRKVKVLAAQRHTSVSRLLTETLQALVDRHDDFEAARRRSLARLERNLDLGTGGRPTWRRDDLHAR
jgi:predicted transcriptional regulator